VPAGPLTDKNIKRPRRIALPIALLLMLCGPPGASAHPLDPLSADEITTAVAVLRAAGDADAETRFPLLDLDEPPKATVLAWQPGQPSPRSAFVMARHGRTVYEGVVALDSHTVTRWQPVANVQTSILEEEEERAQQLTQADAAWQAAMRKRGYETFDQIFCAPLTAGYFADPAEEGRRLLKMVCYDTANGQNNVWGRPIEGLYAVVDLDENKVIRVVDSGFVPVSRDPAGFSGAPTAAAMPAANRGFSRDGSAVRWQNWSFQFRMDRRVGPIVSLLRYRDQERERMVLYRGSLAEMFVPYMDPDGGWAFRTYLDAGEYGIGGLSSPLMPGIDCPAVADFIDATLADDGGEPVILKSRMCLFERDTGDPLWRHAEFANRNYAGRPAVELVLRSIASIGNYDYVIDWVLNEAGVIRIDVGATGIDQVKGVTARDMADPSARRDTAYGTLVAPHLTAVNHDHFLSFRLDVDIDGQGNTLVRQKLVPDCLGAGNDRQSLWRVIDETVTEEGPPEGAAHGGAEIWRVVNPNLTNALGQHPGYELRPGHSVTSMLSPDDFPQRRAGFTAAPLWITAYDPKELYAAGPYPNQSKGGDGLPAYVAQHRPVTDTDIVLWYTMGFHHVPRPEDWPVMPTMWHSVSLVPDSFFARNPALGSPADAAPGQTGK
jgi:primary-amine oxidase